MFVLLINICFVQLDKMVGGLAGGKTKARGQPPGNIQRPTSLSDFNEAEEESWSIDRMSDKDIMDVRSLFYFYNLKKIIRYIILRAKVFFGRSAF